MIHPQRLLADLQSLLPKLERDILDYSQTRPELAAHLQAEYAKAQAANRTAEHFVAWREAQITQAAAAWVLTGVFVRFLEDNRLLEAPLLSGPAAGAAGQGALQQAKDRLTVYFNAHPTHAERDYLLAVFERAGVAAGDGRAAGPRPQPALATARSRPTAPRR